MDVVILNTDEGWPDTLRYCIRSIEQYCEYDSLYVVGYLPDYLDCNHIPQTNEWPIAQIDGTDKLRKAVEHPEISDEFILFHDDMYLLESYQPTQYHHGWLSDKYDNLGDCKRKNCIRITLKYLGQGRNYELHFPMPMIKSEVQEMLSTYRWKYGIVYYSLYANLYDSFAKEDRKDCKIMHQKVTESDIKGQRCFSTQSEGNHLKELMETIYPKPSVYEVY